MLLPYKPALLPLARSRPKYIIIHDSSCMFPDIDIFKVDAKLSQSGKARDYNWILNNQEDVNYHYICERIGKDFETTVGRPLNRMCMYEDIPDQFMRSIHVCCMGRYDVIQPTQRFYQQLSYRVIAPMLYWFGIPMSNIYLHNEVSVKEDMSCPGSFFRKNVFLSALKPMKAR